MVVPSHDVLANCVPVTAMVLGRRMRPATSHVAAKLRTSTMLATPTMTQADTWGAMRATRSSMPVKLPRASRMHRPATTLATDIH